MALVFESRGLTIPNPYVCEKIAVEICLWRRLRRQGRLCPMEAHAKGKGSLRAYVREALGVQRGWLRPRYFYPGA